MPAWAAHPLLASPAVPSRCRSSAAQRPLHDRVRCSGRQLLDRALDRLADPQVRPQRPPVLHHRDPGRPLHITADSLPALRRVLEAINGARLRTSVAELGIWSRTAATLGNRHPSAPARMEPPFRAARSRIVQLVMAVHKEYSVRSWLRHRVSATIGIRLRRRGGGLKAWLQWLGNHPGGEQLAELGSEFLTAGDPECRECVRGRPVAVRDARRWYRRRRANRPEPTPAISASEPGQGTSRPRSGRPPRAI
jgi:hypothetical protein